MQNVSMVLKLLPIVSDVHSFRCVFFCTNLQYLFAYCELLLLLTMQCLYVLKILLRTILRFVSCIFCAVVLFKLENGA